MLDSGDSPYWDAIRNENPFDEIVWSYSLKKTIILGVHLGIVTFDCTIECVKLLWEFILGYLVILAICMVIEVCIIVVSLRGSILNTAPRSSMQYLLYIRLGVLLLDAGWLTAGIVWLVYFYVECPIEKAKHTVLGLIICNWCIIVSIIITVWCTYDTAGRSWVKMKQYQRSIKDNESKFQYKRSGSTRNWRQRKVLRAYQDSWQSRCRFLFCCMRPSDRNRNSFADIAKLLSDFFRDLDVVPNSFADIAKLLSDFFRDLDVVPSDVIAGLILLRKFQKIERRAIVQRRKNDTYEFLSGVAVTPRTQFLALHEDADLELFQTVIHFAYFAIGAYGWPIYVMTESVGICKICPNLRCCCCNPCRKSETLEIVDDNCCFCNYAALQKITEHGNIEVIYVTYHVDVGQTPFFIALDYDRQKIVISIRGTLSMNDILTDLNAEAETLPLNPPQEDWVGHKGMVEAAQYILTKLRSEDLLERAFNHCPEKGTREFKLVIVGHSLGAGTACILGILLRQQYTDLLCYCYSPPGGLLSMPAVEYTKSFTISVVVGKDVVPRIGLHQMEALRADLINAIKRSVDPKWKTITCSIVCCGCCALEPTSAVELSSGDHSVSEYMTARDSARVLGVHPSDSSIALTSHQPLYPPGRIIHIVRHHPTKGEQTLTKKEPVYQALWAQNTDYDEVLISPVMIQDHMPDRVLEALSKVEKSVGRNQYPPGSPIEMNKPPPRDTSAISPQQVITAMGPRKPQRSSSTSNAPSRCAETLPTRPRSHSPQATGRIYLETSFTSLQSCLPSTASSVTNGLYSTTSQSSPLPLTNVLTLLNQRARSTDIPVSIHVNVSRPSRSRLSLNIRPPIVDSFAQQPKIVDLIHDDWLGLAPLASPESLSEVSSISSRASFTTNLDKIQTLSTSYELKTPMVMRRTPKIVNNLSTCADDIRNVRYFQKLGQLSRHLRRPSQNGSSVTNSSSNISFASANSSKGSNEDHSVDTTKCCNIKEECVQAEITTTSGESDEFQSAEEALEHVIEKAGCSEFFGSKSTTTFLETHFDEVEEV
ncbi:Lipase (class 3), partial [Popillia japonica]